MFSVATSSFPRPASIRPPHEQSPPTTTPRAAGDGTIVTTASDSPLEQPESTAGGLFPPRAHKAHFKQRRHFNVQIELRRRWSRLIVTQPGAAVCGVKAVALAPNSRADLLLPLLGLSTVARRPRSSSEVGTHRAPLLPPRAPAPARSPPSTIFIPSLRALLAGAARRSDEMGRRPRYAPLAQHQSRHRSPCTRRSCRKWWRDARHSSGAVPAPVLPALAASTLACAHRHQILKS